MSDLFGGHFRGGGVCRQKPKGVGGFHPRPHQFPRTCAGNGGVSKGNQRVWEVSTSHTNNSLYLYLVQVQVGAGNGGVSKGKPKGVGNSSAPGVISDRFWLIDRYKYKWQGTWKVTGYDWLIDVTRYKYKASIWGWTIWGGWEFQSGTEIFWSKIKKPNKIIKSPSGIEPSPKFSNAEP